jgi:Cd2+/Zn2+-exporting ATPase
MNSVECKNIVEYVLDRTGGILTGNVAYAAERLVVEYDSQEITSKDIEEKVRSLGYELEEPEKGHQCCHHHEGLAANLQMPLAIVAGILIALGLALNFLNPSMGHIANGLFLAAGISAGFFAVKAAFTALRSGLIDIESLMVLAGVGAALMGAIFEGAFLLFLFSFGHALEHRAIDKARKAIDALGQLRAETARVRRDGTIKELAVSEVLRGDIMLVRPGDRIALDGLIKEGQTSIDESTITGESIPVAKEAGAEVFAGTCNVDALIEVEVTRLSSETVLSRIIEMVSDAEAQKGNSQKMAKKIERTLVPIVLGGAPLLVITLLATGMEFKAAMLRGISLLVAASPCALAIATPAAVLSAIGRAAHSGILFKGGAYLEMLGSIDTIAFDKTGTLTVGSPHVMTVMTVSDVTQPDLLKIAATAESHSTHPIAIAIVKAANERGVKYGDCTQVTAVHGKGLRAQWEGTEISLGSMEMFENDNVPAELKTQAEDLEKLGQTVIVVKNGSKFMGVLGVADKIRPEAKNALSALKSLGIKKNVMLSGDNQRVADAIGQQAGIDEAFAQLLPEEKVAKLRTLAKADTGVAMVGDGVNDAPALAAATIGIAMGGTGSDVALETADIVLMSHGLGRLPFAIKLAREATRTIHQNVFVAIAVGAVLVLASIFGWVQVSSAVILHEGSTLVVLLNGLRLLTLKED